MTSSTAADRARMSLRYVLALVAIAAGVLGGAWVISGTTAGAQVPPTEEQALAVEQQLLCPICTNERLDVCSIAICRDMKQIIRERLEAGSTPDDIILYFETRYGPKVRAQLEPAGFNLWLYGWIVAATATVGGVGGWFLYSLRRKAARPATASEPEVDEAWLDSQIADGDDDSR